MEISRVSIDALIPDPSNARMHDEVNIAAIKGSLAKFGQQKPIVITKNNVVVAGNGTMQAAKALGWTELDVVYSELSGTEAIAYALSDNRTAELGSWNKGILGKQLLGLSREGFGIANIGFDPKQWIRSDHKDEKIFDESKENEIPDAPSIVQSGDIWILGDHRLMCGDSTSKDDVLRLINTSSKIDVCMTSPPYNAGSLGCKGGVSKYKNKDDDSRSQENYFDFLCSFTDIALDQCDYVFVNNQFLSGNRHALGSYFGKYAQNIKEVFPWIKTDAPPNINRGVFTNRFEFWLCLEPNNKTRSFPVDWQGKFHNVIEGLTAGKENLNSGKHSATMPMYVPLWFIEKLDFVKTVYEPFCGSGTTLIACEKTGKQCFGMEMEPNYCDIILKRWETVTGKKAVKL